MGHVVVGEYVAAEPAVDGRCRVELHLRAEVGPTALPLLATSTRMLRLDRDALSDASPVHSFADGCDSPGQFVPEDNRGVDDEVTDAAVPVVMHVRPADSHGGDLHQHLMGARSGDRSLLDLEG